MRSGRRVRARTIAVLAAACLAALACSRRAPPKPVAAPPRVFPTPIFAGLSLGMTRGEVANGHAIRPSLTAAGRNLKVWLLNRPGEYVADLTFQGTAATARLLRIDIHFGASSAGYEEFLQRFVAILGAPDVKRRRAGINAYGDRSHDEFETIWSDATQYVYLTERVPKAAGGRSGRTVYYLTVKKKEITAGGPPTGYTPPPPPLGPDGKPVEEPPF